MASWTRPSSRVVRQRRHASLISVFSELYTLYLTRKSLKDLDDHILDDIGVTREQAQAEARRSPWDAPSNWLR